MESQFTTTFRQGFRFLVLGLFLLSGCAPKSDPNAAKLPPGTSPSESAQSTTPNNAAALPHDTTPTATATNVRTTAAPTNNLANDRLDFSQAAFPIDAGPDAIISYIASLDKSMQDLLRAAGSPKLTRDEATQQARRISDLKLEAAERLDAKADTRFHKEMALLAKMEALSHATGLGDPKSAVVLRELASQSAAIESKLVAHQAAIVLLGFELSDLAAGLTDPKPVLYQLDQILLDPAELKLPDFHVCGQTLKVLQQHGLEEAYETVKAKVLKAFGDRQEPQLAMQVWYLKVGSSPAFIELDAAMKDPQVPIADFQRALTAIENVSPTQWTLRYLLQYFTDIEFSGQLEKAGAIASMVHNRMAWIKLPELKSVVETLLDGFEKRIAAIGQPLELEGQINVATKEVFDPKSLTGKVILVDFWASWCGACRAEFPNLRELYGKYRDRGFEIVGVNVDDISEDMVQALQREPLPWLHVRAADPNLKGFENPLAAKFGLSGIPFLILIGQDGKVIAIHTRGLELSRQLAQLFPN